MNKVKPLVIGLITLLLLFSVLISLMFCSIGVSIYKDKYQQNKLEINKLNSKVDSLETIVNANFKNKKDTIIINIVPQSIKIYQK